MTPKPQRGVNWKPQEDEALCKGRGTMTTSYCFSVRDHQPTMFSMEGMYDKGQCKAFNLEEDEDDVVMPTPRPLGRDKQKDEKGKGKVLKVISTKVESSCLNWFNKEMRQMRIGGES
ncbi:unnamed protein product [Prunus armeniaca]